MPEPLSKADREQLYTEFLRTEGYLPDLDKDDAVIFTKGDLPCLIPVDDDAGFFRIMSGIWPIENPAERAKARKAIHAVMANAKVAKLYIEDDHVWVAVQVFCNPPEAFKPIFGRCMTLLEYAVEQFVAKMQ